MVPDYSAPPSPGVPLPSGIPRIVHIVGIGGAGMAALAEILHGQGHTVQGSDLKESSRTEYLQDLGMQVFIGHDGSHIAGVELLVHSTAIDKNNVEMLAAAEAGVPIWSRSQLLEALSKLSRVLAVAGSHGKTTTTSMLSLMLVHAGLHPSFLVGGDGIGSGGCWDKGDWFIVEADESDGSFLSLSPDVAIVTSLDSDHHTRYGTYDEVCQGFVDFLETVSGLKVLHQSVLQKLTAYGNKVGEHKIQSALAGAITYGGATYGGATYGDEADYRIEWPSDGAHNTEGHSNTAEHSNSCQIYTNDKIWAEIELAVPGRHNAENAVAALIAAHELEVPPEVGAKSLQRFAGVSRRFEFKGTHLGATFIDDYAHLPAEVEAAIATAKGLGPERIICVFQPHRYSRTKHLWQDFGPAFAGVDSLIVCDIYSSNEMPLPGVTGDLVARAAAVANPDIAVMWLPQLQDVALALEDELRPGDICLVLGAGDVYLVVDEVMQRKNVDSQVTTKQDWSQQTISGQIRSGQIRSGQASSQDIDELLVDLEFVIEKNWPLGLHTTYRVGGPARFSIEVSSRLELAHLGKSMVGIDIPILVLGKGSNMLVSDNGFDGLVIRLAGEFNDFEIAENRLRAGGMCALPTAARRSAAAGLSGFEWAVGVPGTVGGGVRMNAGGHGSDISQSLATATCFDLRAAILRTVTTSDLALGYRTSAVQAHEVICDASFLLSPGDPANSRQEIADILRWRRENQPGGQNCGSVFRNPTEGAAGLLLDEAGLKGHRYGSAQISQKHANFIISDRGGSAEDVLRLMCEVADDIERKTGIRLEAETVLVGFGDATEELRGDS